MKKILVGLSVLLMSAGAYAESIKVSTSSYAPYVIVADGKVTSGVYVELLNAILKQSGTTVEYMAAPWKRATTMAEEGSANATMPWFKTNEREAIYLFSEPIIEASNKVFIKKGGKVPSNLDWKSYADFKPYKMGGTIGFWYEEGFKKAGVPLELVASDDLNVKKLQAGRIDAFITDELVGKYLIKIGYPGQEGDFDTVVRPDSIAALHVMVAKKSPGSANLIQSINEGLKKIKASGEYDKIVAKYK